MVTRTPSRRPSPPKPEPRNRDATRKRILAAVGALLARDGFSGLGVNAVAREAGIDKVLIYRYFGGIEALLDTWGRNALGEPSPVARRAAGGPRFDTSDAGVAESAAAALLAFARTARENPQALEVMRWELVEDNALTRQLARLRESAGLVELARLGIDEVRGGAVDVPAVAALLSAGLLHLALRAKTAPRWLDIPIRTRQGWDRLERAAVVLVRATLSGSRSAASASGTAKGS